MEMELQRGFGLFLQQTMALLKKNLLISMRSKRSTFLQLFSSLLFMGLLFGIQKGMDYKGKHPSPIRGVTNPKPMIYPTIPPCEHKFFMKRPCYDFVWSGSGNPRIQSIVHQIQVNNPRRPIPPTKVKSFSTKDELTNWLLNDPMRTPGALHFVEQNATVISYGILTNTSTYIRVPRQTEDPTFQHLIPLQLAASREIARSLLGDAKFSWNVGFKEFAHPALEDTDASRDDDSLGFPLVTLFSPIFFYAVSMFGFVFQISLMVLEKELKLRQAMTVMGLYDSAYWCSWLIWEGVKAFVSSLLIVLFGMMFQLHLFLRNGFTIVLLLFFLFQLNMVGFAFLMSNFIRKSSSTTSAGFAIFVLGVATQIFAPLIYGDTRLKTRYKRILWSFFPPNPFAGGMSVLSDNDGISWRRLSGCPSNESCYSMLYYYRWLISTFFLWLVLAIYLDNIIPNSAGVRKPFFYFIRPGYWTGRSKEKPEEKAPFLGSGSAQSNDNSVQDNEGVVDEEDRVKQQVKEGIIDPNVAVQLRNLSKTYSGSMSLSCHSCCLCCLYCTCKIKKPYRAVQDLWLNLEKDQLFCLLGPNGAGKTTVIGCLTGVIPVTRGDALIYGNSIRSAVGISSIRKLIGVCSQFDTLWDSLSGQEHLELFASIKGLSPASKRLEAKSLLVDVKLDDVAKVRASGYSGGMKRRLSLAIALIGNPKLLFLDEPTTGMDPVTRRHIWSVIEAAKQGRSIVLTTHSMEEADILSDRIGIMAKGRLRCIGTSTTLKSLFGAGFITKVSLNKISDGVNAAAADVIDRKRDSVKEFFGRRLDVAPKEEDKYFLTFVIPHEKENQLEKFFAELENRKMEFGILNIQIGLTSLEEVFLNIAKKAELEEAESEGRIKTLTLASGTTLQVPVGAKIVEIPGTTSSENPRGLMVEVYWEQDDHGNLCISGHSDEIPVPPGLQVAT